MGRGHKPTGRHKDMVDDYHAQRESELRDLDPQDEDASALDFKTWMTHYRYEQEDE